MVDLEPNVIDDVKILQGFVINHAVGGQWYDKYIYVLYYIIFDTEIRIYILY